MTEDILDELEGASGPSESVGSTESTHYPPPFSESGEEYRIGHITIQDDTVTVGYEDSLIRAFIRTTTRDGIRVGNYVRIPYPVDDDSDPAMLLGVIAELEYAAATDITDRRDGGYTNPPGEQEFSYVATIDPISIVTYNSDRGEMEQNTVDKPPKPGAETYLVESEAFLRTGLRIPQQGAFLGHMAVSGDRIPNDENPLAYYLFNPNATDGTEDEGEPAIFRHIQVAGSTGKGKTHFSKNILRQLVTEKEYTIEKPPEEVEANEALEPGERQRGLNVCILDPEDEYVEMRHDPPEEALPADARDRYAAQDIAIGGIDNDAEVECRVFAPCSLSSESTLDNVEEFGIPFRIVQDHPQLLYAANPQPRTRTAIKDTIEEFFRHHQDESQQTYRTFSQWAEAVFDNDTPTTPAGDDIVSHDAVKEAVADRLVDRYEYNQIFDHGNQMLDELTSEMFRGQQVTVIPTGHLRGTVDRLIVSCILAHIVRNKIGSNVDYPEIKGTPLLLALDEAHEYLSESEDPRELYLITNYRQAAKRGRKDLFGLYNITQNPADIDEEISKQTNTRIYLGLERDVAESHDVFVPKEFVNQVTQFGKGQAVVKQPDVRPVEIMGLNHCVTRHSN